MREKMEDRFNKDLSRLWKDIWLLTNNMGNQIPSTANKAHLAEELNCVFAHFEMSRAENRVAPALSAVDHPLIPQRHKENPR